MKDAKIIGFIFPLYLAIGVLLTVAMYVRCTSRRFYRCFRYSCLLGLTFMWLGATKIPIVNTYVGGQIPAAFSSSMFFNVKVWIFPETTVKTVKTTWAAVSRICISQH